MIHPQLEIYVLATGTKYSGTGEIAFWPLKKGRVPVYIPSTKLHTGLHAALFWTGLEQCNLYVLTAAVLLGLLMVWSLIYTPLEIITVSHFGSTVMATYYPHSGEGNASCVTVRKSSDIKTKKFKTWKNGLTSVFWSIY